MKADVSLQINLAPPDLRHACLILPHQIRKWGSYVAEILLVIDTRRGKGRFADRWDENLDGILDLAHSIKGARVITVNYNKESHDSISNEFFAGRRVPFKDFRGGPFYSYFFGLHAASSSLVLHSDSDMLFGGNCEQWLVDAIRVFNESPDVLVCAPLPGPPLMDGRLLHLPYKARNIPIPGCQIEGMSTRLFMIDRSRFSNRIGFLKHRRPSLKNCLLALLDGNPLEDLPEHLFTLEMNRLGLCRFEFLGNSAKSWSLHPPYRCEDFYKKLPHLIELVETNNIPEGQLGDHDINDSLVDWTEARKRMADRRWWKRLCMRLGVSK